MSLEEFKFFTAGLQSIVLVIAVIVGGVWALYRFFSLKSIETAKAELIKIKQELTSQAILEIELVATSLEISNGVANYINVLVKVKNCGNKEEVINWDESTLKAVKLTHNGNEEPIMEEEILGYSQLIGLVQNSSVVSPNQINIHSFIIPINKSGVYLIDAKLIGSINSENYAKESIESSGIRQSELYWWGGSIYYEVPNKIV